MEIMNLRIHKDKSFGYLKIIKKKKMEMKMMKMMNGGMFISLP